jgi:hypothetical protein
LPSGLFGVASTRPCIWTRAFDRYTLSEPLLHQVRWMDGPSHATSPACAEPCAGRRPNSRTVRDESK